MSTIPTLFTPTRLGAIEVANRIAMAPLTRSRAGMDGVQTPLAVDYYRQRASAGLLIAEATNISRQGRGYAYTPGIYTDEHVAAWRAVTDAVHAEGGRIVLQLWHVGRMSHVSLQEGGAAPVAPSALPAGGTVYTEQGFEAPSAPRALRTDEIPGLIEDYRQAALRAQAAGFDGVEVHAANGYLLEQFLRDSTNHRTDAYGGSIENRARLLVEVMNAVVAEIGAGRTGIRLSPVTPANDAHQDSDAQALYGHVVEQLAPLELAFIHVVEGATGGPRDVAPFDYAALRSRFKHGHAQGAWVANNGYTRAMALAAVASGAADAVAFGKLFIGNPDLVQRLRDDAPLAGLNQKTLYGGGAEGYIDYPTLQAATA